MQNHTIHSFISESKIAEIVTFLSKKINNDYKKILADDEKLIVLLTMKGALYFGADLTRKLEIPVIVDTIRISSYGSGTKSSGIINLIKDFEIDPKNQHVLVIDEIVDSGKTAKFLLDKLKPVAKSARLCSLLSKPSRREVEVNIDYCGLEVEDKFLVGYGLDFNEQYRSLKEIYTVEF
jgi:hypoxanthine phosphoribosyltransferase